MEKQRELEQLRKEIRRLRRLEQERILPKESLDRKQRYEQKRRERYAAYQALVKEKNSKDTSNIRKLAIDRAINAHFAKEKAAHDRRMEKQRELRAAKK